EVNGTFNSIASRAGTTPEKFAQALAGQGVSADMVKNRIRADLGWSQIIRGRFQSKFQIRERDILDTLNSGRKDDQPAGGDAYMLAPILLTVPRHSSDETVASRTKEAEALRGRFQNCDEGIRIARGMRDVAVREPVIRTSGDLTASLREILDKTAEG